jgi:hypothetical protein
MSDNPKITIEAYGQSYVIEFLGPDGHRDPSAMDQEGTLGRAVLEAMDRMRSGEEVIRLRKVLQGME